MADIELVPVTLEHKTLLWRLLQLYLHDMSEFQKQPFNDAGEFEYTYFENYFDPSLDFLDRGRWAFLFMSGGGLAGFAMVRLMQNGRYEMAEFFILRGSRRGGLGLAAASAVLKRFPAGWDLTILPRNEGAKEFWKKVIAANARGEWTEKSGSFMTWHQFQI